MKWTVLTTTLNLNTLDAGVSLVCFGVVEMLVCLQSECTDDSNGAGAGNSDQTG